MTSFAGIGAYRLIDMDGKSVPDLGIYVILRSIFSKLILTEKREMLLMFVPYKKPLFRFAYYFCGSVVS